MSVESRSQNTLFSIYPSHFQLLLLVFVWFTCKKLEKNTRNEMVWHVIGEDTHRPQFTASQSKVSDTVLSE